MESMGRTPIDPPAAAAAAAAAAAIVVLLPLSSLVEAGFKVKLRHTFAFPTSDDGNDNNKSYDNGDDDDDENDIVKGVHIDDDNVHNDAVDIENNDNNDHKRRINSSKVDLVDKVRDKYINNDILIVTLPRSTMISMMIRDVDAVLLRRKMLSGREGSEGV